MAALELQPRARSFHVRLARDVPVIGDTLRVIVDAWQRTKGRNWIFWVYLSTYEIAVSIIWRVICILCPWTVEQVNSYACRKLDDLKYKYPSITLPSREVTRQFQERCSRSPAGSCVRILALVLRIYFRAVTFPASLALRALFLLVDLIAFVIAWPAKTAASLVLVLATKPIVEIMIFCMCLKLCLTLLRIALLCIVNDSPAVARLTRRNRVLGMVFRAARAVQRRQRRLRRRLLRRGPSRAA